MSNSQGVTITVNNVTNGNTSSNTSTSTTNDTWVNWDVSTNNRATNISELISQFEAGTWHTASNTYDYVMIKSDGKVYEGTSSNSGFSYTYTSNVIGTWESSNDQLNITLTNGEILHLRVATIGADKVIQNTEF